MTILVALLSILMLCLLRNSHSIIHERSLVWTMQSEDPNSVFDILGIVGDPRTWVYEGYKKTSYSYFGPHLYRNASRRDALSFDFTKKWLYFSDNGLKTIFKTTVEDSTGTTFEYNSTLTPVYSSTSNQVNAITLDWMSGSLYWADAQLNIIKVANPNMMNIARTIVSQQLEKPLGIAVYPYKGLLYWSNNLPPSIEYSTLDGKDRKVLISGDLGQPTTLSLDHPTNALFFIDALKGTLEKIDLVSKQRMVQVVRGRPVMSGLSHFEDFLFLADKLTFCIEVLNKTTLQHITNVEAGLFNGKATPLDIRMYDLSLQEPFYSNCITLKCEHICISDGVQMAHCICADGFEVSKIDPTKCNNTAPIPATVPAQIISVSETPSPFPTVALVIIIIIIVLVLLLIIAMAILLLRRRKRKRASTPSISYSSDVTNTTVIKTYVCEHQTLQCQCAVGTDSASQCAGKEEGVYSEIEGKKGAGLKGCGEDYRVDGADNDYAINPVGGVDNTYENEFSCFAPFDLNNDRVFTNAEDDLYDDRDNKSRNRDDLVKAGDNYDQDFNNNCFSNSNDLENIQNEYKMSKNLSQTEFEPANYISEIYSNDFMHCINADKESLVGTVPSAKLDNVPDRVLVGNEPSDFTVGNVPSDLKADTKAVDDKSVVEDKPSETTDATMTSEESQLLRNPINVRSGDGTMPSEHGILPNSDGNLPILIVGGDGTVPSEVGILPSSDGNLPILIVGNIPSDGDCRMRKSIMLLDVTLSSSADQAPN